MKSKRAMWIFAAIPMIVTSIVLQFMPDTIPMHHDLAGNTDRWGSKMESFIFPIIILLITLFWNILICIYEKKAVKSQNDGSKNICEIVVYSWHFPGDYVWGFALFYSLCFFSTSYC